MTAYHLAGPSGAGKSAAGRVLAGRGFHVIETDAEPGLSGWHENRTQTPVSRLPAQPFPAKWLAGHSWLWNGERLKTLLVSAGKQPVFICGGAWNESEYYQLFEQRFGLWVDDKTLKSRLQQREPDRWGDGSVELGQMLEWNRRFRSYCQETGAVLINASPAPEVVACEILDHL